MLSERDAEIAGKSAGRAAASWLSIDSQEQANDLLEMLEDGDPRLDEYLPRRPDLSGEFSGESMNEILEVDDDDDPDDVQAIADIWQNAADEAYDAEINRIIDYHAGDDD